MKNRQHLIEIKRLYRILYFLCMEIYYRNSQNTRYYKALSFMRRYRADLNLHNLGAKYWEIFAVYFCSKEVAKNYSHDYLMYIGDYKNKYDGVGVRLRNRKNLFTTHSEQVIDLFTIINHFINKIKKGEVIELKEFESFIIRN